MRYVIVLLLSSCAYNTGGGSITMTINRELGIDSQIAVPVNAPASAPVYEIKSKGN